ncbi:MAG: hypothetical protein N838_25050 [Thiohalocapsa sp. PB-PSB1]|nr:MAG: hypothetical protein N838_25050 [Thiohalocapsa sp. PB-PSB1]
MMIPHVFVYSLSADFHHRSLIAVGIAWAIAAMPSRPAAAKLYEP